MAEEGIIVDVTEAENPTTQAVRRLKDSGYIKQRQGAYHSLRIRIRGGRVKADELAKLAKVANQYGSGEFHFTMRKGIEIPWVKFEDLEAATKAVEEAGFVLAGCGPRTRAVFNCMGSVCPYSAIDVFAIVDEMDRRYFDSHLEQNPRRFPHKFKMSVTGCAIGCAKPQFNEVGLMGVTFPGLEIEKCIGCRLCAEVCQEFGSIDDASSAWEMVPAKPEHDWIREEPVFAPDLCIGCGDCLRACPTDAIPSVRSGLRVFIGGKFGRHPSYGHIMADYATVEEAFIITDRVREFYQKEGKRGERLSQVIERVGMEEVRERVLQGLRKELGEMNPRLPRVRV